MRNAISTRRLSLSAMLLAVMLLLGYIESLFPVAGLPGIKLGLSNGVLLVSLHLFGFWHSMLLMLGKVLLSALLFGGIAPMLYALAGGIVSMTGMWLAMRPRLELSSAGTGIVGAICHNMAQLALATAVVETRELAYYGGILLASGALTGAATGIAAGQVLRHAGNLLQKLSKEKEKTEGR